MSDTINNSFFTILKHSGITSFLQNKPNNYYQDNIEITNLNNINNINDLVYFINRATNCKLNIYHKNPLILDGNSSSKIMLIVGGPNKEDQKKNKLCSGIEGNLIDKMIKAINLSREIVSIVSAIPWVIEENREPTSDEILQCLPFLQKHIEIVKPKIILLLGETACKAILNTPLKISKLRQKWHEYKTINTKKFIPVLATYHPLKLIKSPSFKKESWEDLKKFKKKINDENL